MWRLLAIVALLWPGRVSGMLDGAPLDVVPEAVLLGLVTPVLAWLHPSFLRHRLARAAVIALLAIKVAAPLVFQQQGWCLAFTPPKPMVRESTGKPHSWDIRADWLADDPRCSAVMTRAYHDTFALPVWFFNLPPPDDAPHRGGYGAGEILVRVQLSGYLEAPSEGAFALTTGPAMETSLRIDGARIDPSEPGRFQATLQGGRHAIDMDGVLASKHWPIVPAWNGHEMGSPLFPSTALQPASALDRLLRPFASWIQLLLAGALVVSWLASWARAQDRWLLAWCAGSAGAVTVAALLLPPSHAAAYTAGVLVLTLCVAIRPRLRNARGVLLLAGVPWLAYFAAANVHQIGRWTLYGVGNDNFLFQRYSYRVFMQHFWLEGGQVTFWNQPLYRWIAGTLHMIFGDSSVGQVYWDSAGIMAMALFAYKVVALRSSFEWGLAAALVAPLMFLLGPTLEFVGFGLSEIASASFIYLAAYFAMRNRGATDVIVAGVLVVLGFYTRLNNLPLAAAVAAFALPVTLEAADMWRPRRWWPLVRWRVAIGIFAGLGIGALLFAWRTWYYTGVFGVFHGTQREFLAVWKPHLSAPQAAEAMLSSLMMLLTASDPPAFAWHSLPLMAGAVIALGGMCGVPLLRGAPLPAVAMCVSGCVTAFVTRGWGHEGRFSIHLFGAAAALCGWGLYAVAARLRGAVSSIRYDPARFPRKVES